MSTPSNHLKNESRLTNQNTVREEQEMSTPLSLGQSKLNGAIHEIKTTLDQEEGV